MPVLAFFLLVTALTTFFAVQQSGVELSSIIITTTIDAPWALGHILDLGQQAAAPSLGKSSLQWSASPVTVTRPPACLTRIMMPTLGTLPTRYITETVSVVPTATFSAFAAAPPAPAEIMDLNTLLFAAVLFLALGFLVAVCLWLPRQHPDLDLVNAMAELSRTVATMSEQRAEDRKLIEDLRTQVRVRRVNRISQRLPEVPAELAPEMPVYDENTQPHPHLAVVEAIIDGPGTTTQTFEPLATPTPATSADGAKKASVASRRGSTAGRPTAEMDSEETERTPTPAPGDDGASEAPATNETMADDLVGGGETEEPTAGEADEEARGLATDASDSHLPHTNETEPGEPVGVEGGATAADEQDAEEFEAAEDAPTIDAGDSHALSAIQTRPGEPVGDESGATAAKMGDAYEAPPTDAGDSHPPFETAPGEPVDDDGGATAADVKDAVEAPTPDAGDGHASQATVTEPGEPVGDEERPAAAEEEDAGKRKSGEEAPTIEAGDSQATIGTEPGEPVDNAEPATAAEEEDAVDPARLYDPTVDISQEVRERQEVADDVEPDIMDVESGSTEVEQPDRMDVEDLPSGGAPPTTTTDGMEVDDLASGSAPPTEFMDFEYEPDRMALDFEAYRRTVRREDNVDRAELFAHHEANIVSTGKSAPSIEAGLAARLAAYNAATAATTAAAHLSAPATDSPMANSSDDGSTQTGAEGPSAGIKARNRIVRSRARNADPFAAPARRRR